MIFTFFNKIDRDRVLEEGPWSFDKNLLVIQDYDGKERPSNYVS